MAHLSSEPPVLIVGGGPVGLALAGDLGWRGVPVVLVESGDGGIDQPRMDMVSLRTMEFCRRWDITDAVRNADYPRHHRQDIVYVTGLNGLELGRVRVPSRAETEPAAYSPVNRDRCPQHLFDPILRGFAARQRSVTLLHRHRVVGLDATGERPRVEIVAEGQGRLVIEPRFVVGCDGAGSFVRRAMGIDMVGDGLLSHSVNVAFRCAELTAHHDKGEAYRFLLFGEDGPWASLVAITGYDVWRLQVIGGSVPMTWGEDEAAAAIRRAVGRDDVPFEIISVNNWRRTEAVAERWMDRSVFLAGDAAHVLSPTGGYGMNTGIADAVDLGWKLAAVLDGWGGSDLLASYEAERRPVAEWAARAASANLRRMLALRPPPGALRGDVSALSAWGEEIAATMAQEWFSPGILVGYRYDGSPVTIPDGAPPPLHPNRYEAVAEVGARAPHVPLGGGRSSLDAFGRGFVLVRRGAHAADAAPLRMAASKLGLPLQLLDLDDAAAAVYPKPLTLVRPDGHVAWRGTALPVDAATLLDQVRGAADGTGYRSRAA